MEVGSASCENLGLGTDLTRVGIWRGSSLDGVDAVI